MHHLFVYGTLLEGERNHYYLEKAKLLFRHGWVYGKLFDTNNGYPVLKGDNQEIIYGSVYQVTDEQLSKINELEGYQKGRKNNLYEQITVQAYNDKGESMEALTYIAGEMLLQSSDEIKHGNWKVHNYLKKSKLFYFAYGSCMDDERFRLAGVEQHFKNIIGKGILNDHGFRFSRNSSDGGKADLIESPDEIVEGIIYQVPDEAIHYLYKREGVYSNSYRPAIVTLDLDNGEKLEALTFIGVEKSKETKPTELYATEIIRGATGVLSPSYLIELKQKIGNLRNKSK